MDIDLEHRATRSFDRTASPRNVSTTRSHVGAAARRPTRSFDHLDSGHDSPANTTTREHAEPRLPDEPGLADLLDQQGRTEAALGRYASARTLHERALVLRRRVHGDADPRRIQTLTYLGTLALRENDLEQAQLLYDRAHTASLQQYGPDHPCTAKVVNNLGVLARRRRDPIRASDHLDDALARKLVAHGWQHASVATTLVNLGNLTRASGDLKAALHYYARACEIFEAVADPHNPGLAAALLGMGRVHMSMGIHTSASCMFERALHIRESLPVTPAQLAGVRFLLATALEPHDPTRARALVASTLEEYSTSSPHPDPRHLETLRAWLARFDRTHKAPTTG